MMRALREMRDQDVRLVLLSNTNPLHYERLVQKYPELTTLFDASVLSYQEGCAKPERAIFHTAYTKAKDCADHVPESVLFVDDKPEYVAISEKCGMSGFTFRSYPHFIFWLRLHGVYVQ